jgi:transcriptional regulator with XRE-family HTH domain
MGWNQELAGKKLKVTQAYLSMVERGKRPLSEELTAKVLRVFQVPPSVLPLKEPQRSDWTAARFQEELGRLGYPGYAYLRGEPYSNPAELLMAALNTDDLDQRVTEALPWLPFKYPTMNWQWLVSHAKLSDRQNRLAYVVFLAMEVASKNKLQSLKQELHSKLQGLEHSRLAFEDTLCKESMTQSERKWLRAHRPEPAKHWNLLTDLTAEQLTHAYS